MTEDNKVTLIPLLERPQQLDAFQDINDPIKSQTLRLWDSLISVIFDDKKVVLRESGKYLPTQTEEIEFEGHIIKVSRYPARIGEGETEKEHFPMKKEYKILEALIKIAVENSSTEFLDSKGNKILSVKLTAYRIKELLKSVTGKNIYSTPQINEAINILIGANTIFSANGVELRGPLISSAETRKINNGKGLEYTLTFHPMISYIVIHGGIREYNLQRALTNTDIFTTSLYKRFVHNCKNASVGKSYNFKLSTILKEHPKIAAWKRVEKQIEKVSSSLDKLKGDVILKREVKKIYSQGAGRKKTIDCVFNVWFTAQFIDEQIKANVLSKDSLVIDQEGNVLDYPQRADYEESGGNYIEDLQKWHDAKNNSGKKGDIIERIFK